MNKLVLVGVLLGAVSPAAADDRQGFLGWSKDGTWWAHRRADGVAFCESFAGTPTWPTKLVAEAGITGVACLFEGSESAEGGPVFTPPAGWEAHIVPSPRLGALPKGMSLKVTKAGYSITAGKRKVLCEQYSDGARAKPQGFYLRADGGALMLEFSGFPGECNIGTLQLGAQATGAGGAPAAGDRKAATAANKLGITAYKAHLWSDAITGFRQAIALDPAWSNAHYNLASVAAIVGDLATTRSELAWMSKAGDAEALRLLAKAQKDPDLDAASTDPEVRRLIGLGAYDDLLAEQIATERSGVWSHEGSDCEMPFMLLTFKKNGTLTLKLTLECEGKKLSETLKGKWRDDEGVLQLSGGKSKDGKFSLDGTPMNPIKCKGSSVAGSCLAIAGSEELAFHRGQPEISMGFKY